MRAKDVAEWRKARLQEVGPSSVAREVNLLHRVFGLARLEWGIGDNNPVTKVKRPPAPPGRDRRLEGDEETRLLAACRKARNPWLEAIVICAIETAMRRSELLGLCWTDLNLTTGTAKLRDTKNGDARTVPLSNRATAILATLPRDIHGQVFPTTGNAVKLAWRRAVKAAKIANLHFHDLRHEGTSRLVEIGKLNILEVVAITGYKDLRMLKRYFHPRAADLRKKLGWA